MRRTMIIATLAALCAGLVVAPASSIAKKVQYSGPVDLPFVPSPAGFATDRPAIQLKVRFEHGTKTPVAIPSGTLKVEGLYSDCVAHSYGCTDSCSDVTGCEPLHCPIATSLFEDEGDFGFKVKKNRSFSGVERVDLFPGTFLAVTGRVGKSSVSGTVRAVENFPPRPSDGATALCDSGVLTWTATR
jgi:hypothetical protein